MSVLDTSAWLRSTIWSGRQQNPLWHVRNAPPTGQTPLEKKYAHLAILTDFPWSSKRGPSLLVHGRIHGQQNGVCFTLAQKRPESPPLNDSMTLTVSAREEPQCVHSQSARARANTRSTRQEKQNPGLVSAAINRS